MSAYYELVALAGFTHARPDYAIDSIEIDGASVAVDERGVLWTPFCQLLRFRKAGGEDDPKILLIAPMSGHFATLLRGTIRTLLRDHQVFITDWSNPRNVKLEHGGFSLEDYTQHIIDFVRFIGEDWQNAVQGRADRPKGDQDNISSDGRGREGWKDDICAVGQTLAAQDLCSGLKPYMKTHHLQAGVGHYGVFNGRRWDTQVYPVLRNAIQSSR